MKEIKPDYIHYTRIDTITAEKAKWLLASIELRGMDISDPDEYNKQLEEKMKMASGVLFAAIDCNELHFTTDGFYRDSVESGKTIGYVFEAIHFNIAEFCSWALKLKYNLPDVLVNFVKDHECNCIQKKYADQVVEEGEEQVDARRPEEMNQAVSVSGDPVNLQHPEKTGNQKHNKKTKPPEALTEAIEYVYLLLRNEGNTEILRPKSLYEFLKRFKEFAEEKGKRNQHPYVVERIEAVNPLEKYDTVITKERGVKVLKKGTMLLNSKTYNKQNISRRLSDLRIKYPLPA